ncbi:MAG: HIT family protein [Acidimicrobiales bacterium]
MSLDRLWSGWRIDYISGVHDNEEAGAGEQEGPGHLSGDRGCVFCSILASGKSDSETWILWRGRHTFAILNAFPYTSGHLMVMPYRHLAEVESLSPDEATELWRGVTDAVRALKAAYSPEGINVGANLGRAAGAGVPGHLHMHVLPRWNGDTNFMTSIAEARVMPESLGSSWERLSAAWPT